MSRQPSPLICLLNPGTTLDDVTAAFSGTHPDRPEYSWRATTAIRGEDILIEGNFYLEGTEEIGQFERRLTWGKGARRAIHALIEIYGEHKNSGLANHHFLKIFDFYRLHGYAEIRLEAAGLGPRVWPQFGFEIASPTIRERLLGLLKRKGVREADTPIPDGLFAAWAASREIGDRMVGLETLDLLYRLTNSEISMYFDLANPDQLRIIESRKRAENDS
jgi:hypothetical protein